MSVDATIKSGGKEIPVRFDDATVEKCAPGSGTADWQVIVRMRFVPPELDVLEHMHLRCNDLPALRQAEHGSDVDLEDGGSGGFVFGISGNGTLHSVEAVWVENGEQLLGRLPLRRIESQQETASGKPSNAPVAGKPGLGCGTSVVVFLVVAASLIYAALSFAR
jgi:hypothetical protein